MTGIIGKNVYLSPLSDEHVDSIYSWKNDVELLSLLMAHPILSNKDVVSTWLKKNSADPNQILLGIFSRDDKLIGVIRLMFIDWISKTTELGIYIGTSESKNKGLGTEVMELIVKYAFEGLNLRKITLRVLDSNERAKQVYRKLNFQEEGLQKAQFWSNNKFEDVCLMGLIKDKAL